MLSTGSQISPCPGTLFASKVGSMHCMRPLDGVPAAALLSQSLMACGSPADSCSMICQISSMLSSDTGTPFSCRILIALVIHCSTLPGTGPDGGPPLEPAPPAAPPPPPTSPPPPASPAPQPPPPAAPDAPTAPPVSAPIDPTLLTDWGPVLVVPGLPTPTNPSPSRSTFMPPILSCNTV